jgi:hypothetical protein
VFSKRQELYLWMSGPRHARRLSYGCLRRRSYWSTFGSCALPSQWADMFAFAARRGQKGSSGDLLCSLGTEPNP